MEMAPPTNVPTVDSVVSPNPKSTMEDLPTYYEELRYQTTASRPTGKRTTMWKAVTIAAFCAIICALVAVTVVLITTTLSKPDNVTTELTCCTAGFFLGSGSESCYRISWQEVIWSEANDICSAMDAYLVEINSKEEEMFLAQILGRQSRDVWTGGRRRIDDPTVFVWSHSGTEINSTVVYTNWYPGQPNEVTEGFIELVGDLDWKWNDRSSTYRSNFICERSQT